MEKEEIREYVLNLGASLVGFAWVGDVLPDEWKATPYAISIARRLDLKIVEGIKNGPTIEYYEEYKRANAELALWGKNTAGFLRSGGSAAIDLQPTDTGIDENLSTRFPHKTAATRSGLGWIGKSALLVTEQFGPAVRLITVLTNKELDVDKPVEESRCGGCRLCVKKCPCGAMTGSEWSPGRPRETIYDAFSCMAKAIELSHSRGIMATICGICIAACPYVYGSRRDVPQQT